jgi:hypothetical protein
MLRSNDVEARVGLTQRESKLSPSVSFTFFLVFGSNAIVKYSLTCLHIHCHARASKR